MDHYIKSLKLYNFRNYSNRHFDFSEKNIALIAPNGAGKTNILEAISLLGQGRGLRGVKFDQILNNTQNDHLWRIKAEIVLENQSYFIESHYDSKDANKRISKINDQPIKNQLELVKICSINWLTPSMGNLFIGPASIRRKFLDQLVSNLYPHHIEQLHKY